MSGEGSEWGQPGVPQLGMGVPLHSQDWSEPKATEMGLSEERDTAGSWWNPSHLAWLEVITESTALGGNTAKIL